MSKIVIVGGGVIGMTAAYYLQKEGHHITILENTRFDDGASYGNAGHVVPSHFVPLASPGIVSQGLKWMLSSSSPFYIRPRLNAELIRWGIQFWKNSGASVMHRNMLPLQKLLFLSRELFSDLKEEIGNSFFMKEHGILILYKTAGTEKHEAELVRQAETMGLHGRILSRKEVQELEPSTAIDTRGGVLYEADAHLHPGLFMEALRKYLVEKGVGMMPGKTVDGFTYRQDKLTAVRTGGENYPGDGFVLANGAWMPVLAKKLGFHLLMQGGKGYSITYKNFEPALKYPAILSDHRVVTTPVGPHWRLAGTMEINGLSSPVMPKRVRAIIDSVRLYYPEMEFDMKAAEEVWSGIRPLSPDGLPYIGKAPGYTNLVIAGGHAMLGLSLATGTGKLVTDLLAGRSPAMDINPFSPKRFG